MKFKVTIQTEFGEPHTLTITGANDEKHAEQCARDSFKELGHATGTKVSKIERIEE